MRNSLLEVAKAFFRPQILIPFVALIAWVGAEVWVGARLALWNPALAKGTILWTLGSAGVLLFNCTQIGSDRDLHFFRRTILATVSVAVFVGFFVNLYVMSLPVELGLQIGIIVPSLMVVVADEKPEYRSVKALCELVLAVIGFALFAFAARQIYLDWHRLDGRELLTQFALPIWLTFALLPFLYVFSIYVAYDTAIRRINYEVSDGRSRWRSRLALLSALGFRAGVVRRFTGYWIGELCKAPTFFAARGVVADFLDDLRRAEQARLDEEERLRRFSGSQEADDEGRRLDRREFAATTHALHRLATCQMGWHRNGGRYRRDMLKILGDDFTRSGLPKEPGITLRVARNGQSWYAWRRTVTGWCFAIGAAGPPPDQWECDGPEPPSGFPGRDPSWGDGPFSDQVTRNWG